MESILLQWTKNCTLLCFVRVGLTDNLAVWENLQEKVGRKLLRAVAQASKSADITKDYAFNYRMVDY
jgi:hypothetical protein